MAKFNITRVPDKYQKKYDREQVGQNFNRLLVSGLFILFVQFLAVGNNLMEPFTTHQQIIGSYFTFYYVTIAVNIFMLMLGQIIKSRDTSIMVKRLFVYAYTYFLILWGAGVALADQFQGEPIVVYYSLVFMFSIVLNIETLPFLIIVALNQIMFFQMLTVYERFYAPVFGLRAGSTQILFFIIMVRFYLHELLKRNFVQREDLKEQNEALEFYANYDTLTKVFNRRRWEQSFKIAYSEAAIQKKPLGLLMIDIDSFKEYNDNYGHIQGDIILETFGKLLKETSEKFGGIAGRFGGDEFIVLFAEPDKVSMDFFKKHLEKSVYELNVEHAYSKVSNRLSISIGAHYSIPSQEETMWYFAAKADTALYASKELKKSALENLS